MRDSRFEAQVEPKQSRSTLHIDTTGRTEADDVLTEGLVMEGFCGLIYVAAIKD